MLLPLLATSPVLTDEELRAWATGPAGGRKFCGFWLQGLLQQWDLQKKPVEQKPEAAMAQRLKKYRAEALAIIIYGRRSVVYRERDWIRHLRLQEKQEGDRREFYKHNYQLRTRPMPWLSAERKIELLIQDMAETLAFSSPDERAKLHADW
jgi:hypothetical protein